MFKRASLLLFVFALCAPQGWAQQENPTLGTWILNVAKSKYDPGPPLQSGTTKFEASGANAVRTTVDQVSGQGTQVHYEYTASYDGKDYSVTGSPEYDTVALRRTDPYTTVSIWKKGGNLVRMLRSIVSTDGKTRAIDGVGVNAQGQAYHNVVVYDRR
jgi:hypothetical protein